jgi:hypothetical protein
MEDPSFFDIPDNVSLIGRIEYGKPATLKTKYVKSLLYGLVPRSVKEPPEWKVRFVEGVKYSPSRVAHLGLWSHLGKDPSGKELSLALQIVKSRYTRILSRYKQVHPLTEATSLNGLEGVRYIDKVKHMTGAGKPVGNNKMWLLLTGTPENLTYTATGRASVRFVAESLMAGVNPGIVADVTFKDEVKKPDKDIRTFACVPFVYNELMRRLFLVVAKYVQENYLLTGVTIGVDPNSSAWRKIYNKHQDFRYHVFWDFKFYDKSHHKKMLLAASEVLLHMASVIFPPDSFVEGYPALLLFARGLAVACDIPYVYIDSVFQVGGSLPSGTFHTAFLNTIIQEIILEMAWISHRGYDVVKHEFDTSQCDSFQEEVVRDGLGDDGMLSTDDPEFNLPFLSKFCSEQLGVVMTSPTKGADLPTQFEVPDWNFLKRGFYPDGDVVWAPIERESILKNINWQKPSRDEEEEELHYQFTVSALRECAAGGDHRHRDLYRQIVRAFSSVPQLNSRAVFPSYEEAHAAARLDLQKDKDGTSALWRMAGIDANNFLRSFWRHKSREKS